MTQEEIAKSMGKSRSYIANTIRLLKLNQEETDALAARKISASQARTLLSIKDEDERKKTLDDFINKKINVRDAEKISKKKNSEEKAITKGLSDIDKILLEDYEEKFMEKVGSKVKIDKTGKTYKLIIDCFTVDDIENIYWRLGDEDN